MKNKIRIVTLLCFSFLPVIASSTPLDNLIDTLKRYDKDSSLIWLDYNLKDFFRGPEKRKKIDRYKSKNMSMQNLFHEILKLEDMKTRGIDRSKTLYEHLKPKDVLKAFMNMKSNGETLKNGDLVFLLKNQEFSRKIAKYSESDFSHSAMIFIKEGIPHVIEINAKSDFCFIPLIDYILSKDPVSSNFAIYRYKGELDDSKLLSCFEAFEEEKEKICFDPLFKNNPFIKNPEEYAKNNHFFYCIEFSYLILTYASGNLELITDFRLNLKNIAYDYLKPNPLTDIAINLTDKMNKAQKQDLISFNNFSRSKHFKKIIECFAKKKQNNVTPGTNTDHIEKNDKQNLTKEEWEAKTINSN